MSAVASLFGPLNGTDMLNQPANTRAQKFLDRLPVSPASLDPMHPARIINDLIGSPTELTVIGRELRSLQAQLEDAQDEADGFERRLHEAQDELDEVARHLELPTPYNLQAILKAIGDLKQNAKAVTP